MTAIEWVKGQDGTQGKTWNPISGCSRKSAGCENCYAEVMTRRLEAMGLPKYAGLLNEQGRFNGVVRLDEQSLVAPLKRKKPTTYFVNSMSDLFHENVPDEWIDKIFAVMALCPQHTFQILTKRADRMRKYCDFTHPGTERVIAVRQATAPFLAFCADKTSAIRFPLSSVWLGVSAENQKTADERIPLLLDTPAAVRFVSAEPLLEQIEIHNHLYTRFQMSGLHHEYNALDWVIVGGESGPKARPCNVEWIRSIVAQCRDAQTPVFVKQLGANSYLDGVSGANTDGAKCLVADFNDERTYFWLNSKKGGDPSEWPHDLRIRQMPELEEK